MGATPTRSDSVQTNLIAYTAYLQKQIEEKKKDPRIVGPYDKHISAYQ